MDTKLDIVLRELMLPDLKNILCTFLDIRNSFCGIGLVFLLSND